MRWQFFLRVDAALYAVYDYTRRGTRHTRSAGGEALCDAVFELFKWALETVPAEEMEETVIKP